ncbi:effector-associated constant component EACC1 [Streptomyces sp. CA-135486]|uniref:effector-associated constant component EACC1 n=1 Tax=Streptomyces sp. CA-135486 TaxID=3240049 RepID=UPI003D90D9AB
MENITLALTGAGSQPTGDDELRDLFRRLRANPEMETVRLEQAAAVPGTLGGGITAVEVVVTSGALTALASVLRVWLRTRASRVKISVRRPDGSREPLVELDAGSVPGFDAAAFQSLFTQAMDVVAQTPEGSGTPEPTQGSD